MRKLFLGWGSCSDLHVTSTEMEVENISNCGDNIDAEPHTEAATSLEAVSTSRLQQTDAGHDLQTTGDTLPSRAQSRARSISARSTATERPSQQAPTGAQRRVTVTQPQGRDAETLLVPASTGTQQTRTPLQPDNSTRDSGTRQGRHTSANISGSTCARTEQRVERRLSNIEEPPPLYSNLFPGATVHSATNSCGVQHTQVSTHFSSSAQANYSSPHHSMSLSQSNHHIPLHHCSACYPVPHCNHHTGVLLPGETGHCLQDLRQPTHHSTVVPLHHHHFEQDEEVSDDYLSLSFVCVVLCSLHLNLPALLCVLPALGFSIKAQKLNAQRRYRQAQKYSKGALSCNLIAFCQYIVVVIVTAVLVFIAVR